MLPLLSIILVNWNSAAYVRKCLASVYANTGNLALEILVVDNASNDGCGDMLARDFPQAVFIQSRENLGFARANNLGFQQSRGSILLFLNPDTELVGPAITALVHTLPALPQPGIIGARLLNTDGTLQTSCVQSLPTLLNQTLDSDFLRAHSPRSRLWGTAPLFSGLDTPAEVEVISGACLMLTRDLFEQIGKFSEDYFMYSEDLDLCFKARAAGRKNYYVPQAVIVHHGGGSSQQSKNQFSNVMVRDSVCRFLAKTRGQCYALAYRAAMSLASLFRLSLLAFAAPLAFVAKRQERLLGAFRKWLAVFKWSLGLETWVRKYRPPVIPNS